MVRGKLHELRGHLEQRRDDITASKVGILSSSPDANRAHVPAGQKQVEGFMCQLLSSSVFVPLPASPPGLHGAVMSSTLMISQLMCEDLALLPFCLSLFAFKPGIPWPCTHVPTHFHTRVPRLPFAPSQHPAFHHPCTQPANLHPPTSIPVYPRLPLPPPACTGAAGGCRGQGKGAAQEGGAGRAATGGAWGKGRMAA